MICLVVINNQNTSCQLYEFVALAMAIKSELEVQADVPGNSKPINILDDWKRVMDIPSHVLLC